MSVSGMAQPQSEGPSPRRALVLPLVLGAAVLIVMVALVIMLTVVSPRRAAAASFDAAKTAYNQAQSSLSNAASPAKSIADSADPRQLTDSSTLTTLQSDLATADGYAPYTAGAPSRAADIKRQTSALNGQVTVMEGLTTQLADDSKAVQANQTSWAKAAVSDEIANATSIHNADKLADAASRSGLQSAINAAQIALAGFDQADPASVGTTAQQTVQALQAAEQTMQQSQQQNTPAPCGGVTLPDGADQMVCGGMPAGAITVTPTQGSYGNTMNVFSMPSGNIGCWSDDGGVACDIGTATWSMPADLQQWCQGDGCGSSNAMEITASGVVRALMNSGVSDWTEAKLEGLTMPVAQYGQVIDFAPIACLSATDGVTCWDTVTHHGFKMAAQILQYW